MTHRTRLWIAAIALSAVILSSSIVQAQTANRGRSNFDWIVARRITVSTLGLAVTGGITSDDVTASDDLVVADDADVLGNLATGTFVLSPAAVITVTNGATLSPGGAYQPLAAAGAVGFGAITVGTAGSVLYLVNTVNQTITITDTGTLKLAGNIALGQFDALHLISDGTNWIQVAPVGNN